MPELGRYCKAYLVRDLAALPQWKPTITSLAPSIVTDAEGDETEVPRHELLPDDVVYLQDNYTVTDGIFQDEHILFTAVTDDWKQACHEQLGFEIPEYCREDIIVDASDQYTAEELAAMERMEREAEAQAAP